MRLRHAKTYNENGPMSIRVVGTLTDGGKVDLTSGCKRCNGTGLVTKRFPSGRKYTHPCVECGTPPLSASNRVRGHGDEDETVPLADLSGIHDGPHPADAPCIDCQGIGHSYQLDSRMVPMSVACESCNGTGKSIGPSAFPDEIATIAAPEETETVGDRLARIARDLERIKAELAELLPSVRTGRSAVRMVEGHIKASVAHLDYAANANG